MNQRYIPVVHRAVAAPVLALSLFMVVGPFGGAAFANAPQAPAAMTDHHQRGETDGRLTVITPDPDDTVTTSRPLFAGFGRNGDTVTVWPENGDAICSDEVEDGEWSCTPANDLPEGNQVIRVNETAPDSEASEGLVRLRLFVDPDDCSEDENGKDDYQGREDRPDHQDRPARHDWPGRQDQDENREDARHEGSHHAGSHHEGSHHEGSHHEDHEESHHEGSHHNSDG